MAQISKSAVSLRVMGNDLIPSEITNLLGCEPNFSHKKDEKIEINKTNKFRITRFGMWRIQTERREPEDLNSQIAEIFKKLSSDLSIWESLNKKYTIDLFCGIYMKENMEGMSISPESLKILGERGILLDLDIYGPNENA